MLFEILGTTPRRNRPELRSGLNEELSYLPEDGVCGRPERIFLFLDCLPPSVVFPGVVERMGDPSAARVDLGRLQKGQPCSILFHFRIPEIQTTWGEIKTNWKMFIVKTQFVILINGFFKYNFNFERYDFRFVLVICICIYNLVNSWIN